jgi:hypothetical protein
MDGWIDRWIDEKKDKKKIQKTSPHHRDALVSRQQAWAA